MFKKFFILSLIVISYSCQDIFTTNYLESLKKDPSDMTNEELLSAAEDGDPEALEALLESRITPEEVANDPALEEQFLQETTLLADYMIEEADFQGALEGVLGAEEGENPIEDFLNDAERVEDLETAADLVLEAYTVDPESVTETQKLVAGVGLLSDVITDEDKAEALSSIEVRDEESLAEAGFTQDEIDDIILADELLEGSSLLEDMGGFEF